MVDVTQRALVRYVSAGRQALLGTLAPGAFAGALAVLSGCAALAPATEQNDAPARAAIGAHAVQPQAVVEPPQPQPEPAVGAGAPIAVTAQKRRAKPAVTRPVVHNRRAERAPASTGSEPAKPAPGVQPDMREFVNAVSVIVATLESANIAFNAPTSMAEGRTQPIHLVFGVQRIADQLRTADDGSSDDAADPGRVRHRIEARLFGTGFDVNAVTPEAQPIGSSAVARWHWQAKPLHEGLHPLYLTVAVTAEVQGTTIRRAETFQREIRVEVPPWPQRMLGFAREHWQWLWASMMMPLVGWLWRRQKGWARPAPA